MRDYVNPEELKEAQGRIHQLEVRIQELQQAHGLLEAAHRNAIAAEQAALGEVSRIRPLFEVSGRRVDDLNAAHQQEINGLRADLRQSQDRVQELEEAQRNASRELAQLRPLDEALRQREELRVQSQRRVHELEAAHQAADQELALLRPLVAQNRQLLENLSRSQIALNEAAQQRAALQEQVQGLEEANRNDVRDLVGLRRQVQEIRVLADQTERTSNQLAAENGRLRDRISELEARPAPQEERPAPQAVPEIPIPLSIFNVFGLRQRPLFQAIRRPAELPHRLQPRAVVPFQARVELPIETAARLLSSHFAAAMAPDEQDPLN